MVKYLMKDLNLLARTNTNNSITLQEEEDIVISGRRRRVASYFKSNSSITRLKVKTRHKAKSRRIGEVKTLADAESVGVPLRKRVGLGSPDIPSRFRNVIPLV